MKKIIKKLGNSYVITLNRQDREIYGLREGDHVDLELSIIQPEVLQHGRSE